MREDNMAAYADAIAAYRPEVVVAYVDPVFRLSKWLLAQGRTIRGVGVVLGAAEALHDFQRPIIEAAFPGSRAYNTYGCREFMLIACEAGDRNGLLVNADHLAVELVDASRRSDGSETGEIAITDLHNLGMPFIRYVNGDVATRKGPWHSVGPHGLPRLQRIEGRSLDAIRTTDGNVLPGEFFPHMLKDVTGVRRFQVVQDSLDHFNLKIVPGPEFVADQEAHVRRAPGPGLARTALARLEQSEGPSLDAIRTTDGNVLPGDFFPHMLKDVTGVRRFQVVQDSLDHFTLKIVPGPEFVADQEAYVRREITKVLGNDASLDLQRVDDIPLTASGKFRVTVSRLP